MLTCDYGRPLGSDPRILSLLAERLADAAAEVASLRLVPAAAGPFDEEPKHIDIGETAVVLVGDGSTDPATNADVHRVSRLFWETHAHDHDGGDRLHLPHPARRSRRHRALPPPAAPSASSLVPYLLFAGGLLDRVWAQAMAYAAGHPDLDVRLRRSIGDCESLADVVIERYEEALSGIA